MVKSRWRLVLRRRRKKTVMHHHFAMLRFKLVEFLLLVWSQERSDPLLRIFHDSANPFRGFDSDRFQFGAGRVDNRPDFFFLLRVESQRATQMLPHPIRNIPGMRRAEYHVITQNMNAEEDPRHSTRDKDEEKGESEFPFQRAVHWENSVWIAESAIAYSFVASEANFVSSRYWR